MEKVHPREFKSFFYREVSLEGPKGQRGFGDVILRIPDLCFGPVPIEGWGAAVLKSPFVSSLETGSQTARSRAGSSLRVNCFL